VEEGRVSAVDLQVPASSTRVGQQRGGPSAVQDPGKRLWPVEVGAGQRR
jgi:hypothetical protein